MSNTTASVSIKKVPSNIPNRPEKASIIVEEHVAFEGGTKCQFVNTIELTDLIHALFGAVFSDYYGAKICMNNQNTNQLTSGVLNTVPPQGLYVNLYFKDMPAVDGMVKSITLPGQNKTDNKTSDGTKGMTDNNNMMKRISHIMSSVGSKTYDVTKETLEALEPFMFRPNIRWSDHIREIASQMNPLNPSRQEALVMISGLSLDAIVSEIYGRSTPEGEFFYEIVPVNYVVNSREEFLLRITQMDKKVVREMRDSLGIFNASASDFHVYNK